MQFQFHILCLIIEIKRQMYSNLYLIHEMTAFDLNSRTGLLSLMMNQLLDLES